MMYGSNCDLRAKGYYYYYYYYYYYCIYYCI